MNRRSFLLFTAGLISTLGSAYAEVWAVVGKMGYREVAPDNMLKQGKKCESCGWYKDGYCKFSGIMKHAGSDKVRVKPNGYCTMWKKA